MVKIESPHPALFTALERMEEALALLDLRDQHLIAAQLAMAIDNLRMLLP